MSVTDPRARSADPGEQGVAEPWPATERTGPGPHPGPGPDSVPASGPARGDDPAPVRSRRVVWLRRVLIVVWLGSIAAFLQFDGVPLDRETIIGFTVVGLLVWSVGRRPLWSVLADWLPFVVVLVLYDYARGIAGLVGSPTQWTWQINTDRFLGGGTVPTVWLQEHLRRAQPPWWEIGVGLVYVSFFFVPYLVSGWLWLRSRTDFHAFALRFVGLSFLGVVVFVAMPAAPPWAAAQCHPNEVAMYPADPPCMNPLSLQGSPGAGLIGPYTSHTDSPVDTVERISGRGLATLHLKNAQELLHKGQASVNLLAAVPSLHAAVTLMVSIFLWPRVRRPWRILLLLYPPAMAFALVYSAEHYVTDVLAGWALTVAFELSIRAVARARRRRRAARAAPAPSGPVGGDDRAVAVTG